MLDVFLQKIVTTRAGKRHGMLPSRFGEYVLRTQASGESICLALHSRSVRGWKKIHLCISEACCRRPAGGTGANWLFVQALHKTALCQRDVGSTLTDTGETPVA